MTQVDGIKKRLFVSQCILLGVVIGAAFLAASTTLGGQGRGVLGLICLLLYGLSLMAARKLGSTITKPLNQIASSMAAISSGDLSARVPEKDVGDFSGLAEDINGLAARLQENEAELDSSRGHLDQVLDNIPADVMLFDPEGCFLYANAAAIEDPSDRVWVLGRTPAEYVERMGLVEAGIGRSTFESVSRCVKEKTIVRSEQVLPLNEEESRHLLRFFSPVFGIHGEVIRVIGYGLDLTDLRQAEAELRETQDRLLQAQKMESIGRLAGGVAHDFNNLLTTITGNADLILMDMGDDNPAQEDVHEIHKAAKRAAGLTQQLLAFSRKQVTQPRVINLNESVSSIEKMLMRLIGEDIALNTHLSRDLGNIHADPGQIEQVVVNLAVNSRDAMPKGGCLTIRTENQEFEEAPEDRLGTQVPAGTYAMLAVTDTGEGMNENTKEKIFEPFFTKKGPGEGTGLGLATVYGIVRQAEGFIRVYSEPGMGTTFKIFLPLVDADASELSAPGPEMGLALGSETILVAEDQEGVRQMTRKILERCGYNILSAESPEEALRLARTYKQTIDLVLTDVVMPGMSGPTLVENLSQARPETPVVYMSGYTDDQLQHHGVLHDDVVLIEKPFSAKGLAGTVRMVLNAHQERTEVAQTA